MGNWIDSAQDMDYWRPLVNAALDLRVLEAMELVHSQPFFSAEEPSHG